MKMEAAHYYETTVTNYQQTRDHIQEDCNLHEQHCENFWSHISTLRYSVTLYNHKQLIKVSKLCMKDNHVGW